MKILTKNKIIVQSKNMKDTYLGLDGSSSKNNIKSFQDWMDIKHPNWVLGENLNKGSGYGNFSKPTKMAWNLYGAEYTLASGSVIGNLFSSPTQATTQATAEPTKEQQVEHAKKGKIWDKSKGWIDSKGGAQAFLEKNKGVIDSAKDLFGSIFGGNKPTYKSPSSSPSLNNDGAYGSGLPDLPSNNAMSKNKKIAIGVGAVALLGIIIYVATKPKK